MRTIFSEKLRKLLPAAAILSGIFVAGILLRFGAGGFSGVSQETLPEPIPRTAFQTAPEPSESSESSESSPEETVLPPPQSQQEPESQPDPVSEPQQEPQAAPQPEPQPLPAEINLAIPFTSQAPHANWDLPYQEFCEEASVYMAGSYFRGKQIPRADIADAELRKIMEFENGRFGDYKDTTAEQTAQILREYYGLQNVRVVENITAQEIKQELSEGHPVLVPAAGRELGNPYFRQPGPLYHMLVIKGYLADGRFITNDPGTRRGADFLYDPAIVLRANHDWNGGNVSEGAKVVIVVEE